jgi:hypothetical protein
MSTHRLPTLFIIAALIAVTSLTVREAFATSVILPPADQHRSRIFLAVDRSSDPVENVRLDRQATFAAASCLSVLDRASLSSAYIEGAHGWFPRSSQGFTGVDGGLIELLAHPGVCILGKGE